MVCILDSFVLECCDVVGDDGVWDQEGMRHTNTKTPKLAYPEGVNWRNVKPDLMYRILTLPNELEKADRSISAVAEHVASPPDYEEIFDERHYQFAKLGIAAMDLARDLRVAYGLAQPDYSRWDPHSTLDRAFAAEDEQRQLNAEMSERLVAAHKAKQRAALIAKMPPDKQPI